jgi:glucose-1-phosphate cytidylyltransferase
MKVMILAGGLGTRLQEETVVKPKPMVEIGGMPIVWHIMKIYETYGFNEFYLALGYKAEVLKNYFINYHSLQSDISVHLKSGVIEIRQPCQEDWVIHLIDTGMQTQTGGRIKRIGALIGNEPFMATYGDGVANIDINRLLAFHRQQKRLVTMTAVRPPARFGDVEFKGNEILRFAEKPQVGVGWINGGFFVIEPEALEYIGGDEIIWEGQVLEKLVGQRQVAAYQHEGFWQCMDTVRDMRTLESLWQEGKAPWKIWE